MARLGGHHGPRRHSQTRVIADSVFEDITALAVMLFIDAEDDAEEETAMLVVLLALAEQDAQRATRSGKYGPRGPYRAEKRMELFDNILHTASDRFFRSFFRMDRESFWRLHDIIAGDEIFVSSYRKPQRPVHFQLAAFLSRMGASSGVKTAGFVAIAEGTVYLYCYRVVRAIRRKRDSYLAWPGVARRDSISDRMAQRGFPGCLGSGDGSYFRLEDKPTHEGYDYWCHKKFYAIVLQATVDDRGIFTSYDYGWPGSVQDSRVFKESHLWREREQYFREHEYILVDKGYPLTPFSIRPFNDYDLTSDPAEASRRKLWNQSLSSIRIFVEHAFGRLKGRFAWLRCIPAANMDEVYKILEALIILHNFLESRNDDPTTIEGYHGLPDDMPVADEDAEMYMDLDGDDLHRAGLERRKQLMVYMGNMVG